MNGEQVLKYLSRKDKWYLGGGHGVIWAPSFPQWLDTPGFWDRAQYYDYPLEPGFAVTILDENSRPVPLRHPERDWDPSRLCLTYAPSDGLKVTEERAVLDSDALICRMRVRNDSGAARRLSVVLWTAQPTDPAKGDTFVAEADVAGSGLACGAADPGRHLRLIRQVKKGEAPPLRIAAALGMSLPTVASCVRLTQGTALQPRWEYTPFWDRLSADHPLLDNESGLSGIDLKGLVFMALQAELVLQPGEERVFTTAAAIAADKPPADALASALADRDPIATSRRNWAAYFDGVPEFRSTDPYLEKYYWYRWYGLRLCTIGGGRHNYGHAAVTEGIEYFRIPITYSAQVHLYETRWMTDPTLARGHFLNFAEHQTAAGFFPGHIWAGSINTNGFYHAAWGRALAGLDRVHPDDSFLATAYGPLVRYARYFERERDSERSGLFDVVDQYETGQEYMSRYLFVDPQADSYDWNNSLRLKGIDATVYIYDLYLALAGMAARLGRDGEATEWSRRAAVTGEAIRGRMWDPDSGFFFDVDARTPGSWRRSQAKAAIGFYPFIYPNLAGHDGAPAGEGYTGGSGLAGVDQLAAIDRHLLNPDEFWTPYPVPSTSADDPTFDANAEWRGKRMSCPWNGRTWPMTNSHVAEALVGAAELDAGKRPVAVDFIGRFVRMMFMDGDVNEPNCFEHYHPYNGKPGLYRGIDDYQHSWVVDLIIKYVCGFRPDPFDPARRAALAGSDDAGLVMIDPLPFAGEHELRGLRYRGHDVSLTTGSGVTRLRIDGRESTVRERQPVPVR